jgi:SAM-dependent methyltransferase
VRTFLVRILNNRWVNRFWIALGCEAFIQNLVSNWRKARFNDSRSLQENVGFSHNNDVDEAIAKVHREIKLIDEKYLKPGDRVLDIGCGVGLYLRDFADRVLFGTDLSADFIRKCGAVVPNAKLIHGNYLHINFEPGYFDLIYSVSVLQYIPPSGLKRFFDKISHELKEGGILIIQYPHALSTNDAQYADLAYVSYTPERIESALDGKFSILSHRQSYDGRHVNGVDKKNYGETGRRDFRNGMLVVARKIASG